MNKFGNRSIPTAMKDKYDYLYKHHNVTCNRNAWQLHTPSKMSLLKSITQKMNKHNIYAYSIDNIGTCEAS